MPQKQRYIMMVVPSLPEQGGGGIVQFIGYLQDAWQQMDDVPPMRLLVTRGRGSIWLSPFFLLRALIIIAVECSFGRVALVHVNIGSWGSTWRKLWIVVLSRIFNVPVVLHLHGAEYGAFFAELPSWAQTIVRRLFAKAARVIVLGRPWRKLVVEDIGAAPTSVVILPNAVPRHAETHPQKQHGSSETGAKLLFLGRLGARKGVPELLSALADSRLKPAHWTAVLAGDGEVEEVRKNIVEAGLTDRIEVLDWLSPQACSAQLASADIFVLPSHAEGLSIALLEAMAQGLAIITTPVGAHAETIIDGESGLLVPAGDHVALADAILSLVVDPALRRRLGQTAHARFENHYEISIFCKNLQKLYRELIN